MWSGPVVGIDMSAGKAFTAAVELDVDETGTSLSVWTGVDDERILGWLRSPSTAVGIDAPFGWPVAFAAAVESWTRDGEWPAWAAGPVDEAGWDDLKELLKFRLTDRFVRHDCRDAHRQAGACCGPDDAGRACRWPSGLAVAAEKIAIASFRVVRLLNHPEVRAARAGGEAVDRTGSHGIIEVYPASALSEWCQNRGSYRGSSTAASQELERVTGWLTDQLGGAAPRRSVRAAVDGVANDDVTAALGTSDHVVDAAIAAVVTWAWRRNRTIAPPAGRISDGLAQLLGREEGRRRKIAPQMTAVDIVAAEGWIHHPQRGVSPAELLADSSD